MSDMKRKYCRTYAHTMTNKELADKLCITQKEAGRLVNEELKKKKREDIKRRLEQ